MSDQSWLSGRSRLSDRVLPFALIAVGGFAGAAFRYGLAVSLSTGFPWGTLAANVLGSFALGVVLYEKHFADAVSTETRLVVATGFLSSFTTYSTFAAETAGLAPSLAAANVAANYVLAGAGVVCGRQVARWVS